MTLFVYTHLFIRHASTDVEQAKNLIKLAIQVVVDLFLSHVIQRIRGKMSEYQKPRMKSEIPLHVLPNQNTHSPFVIK